MSATRIGGPWQEGKFIDHCVAKIEFGKAGEVEDISKKVKGIASCRDADRNLGTLKKRLYKDYTLRS